MPGEGPAPNAVMLVGEAPGDLEDLQGRPFVGPAGEILDRALREVGFDRRALYITNAVKHFKFEQRGKRRLHKKPDAGEISACHTWLDQELQSVRPRLVIALGATAARSLAGRIVTIAQTRGSPIQLQDGTGLWVTVHPSYILRIRTEQARHAEYRRFVQELSSARAWAARH